MGNVDAREYRNRAACSLSGPAFLLLLCAMVRLGKLPVPVFYAYLGSSLAALLLYGVDKRAARKKRPRVRERTLHLAGLLGGWPGAALAQRLFHHKSQKASFQFLFRVTVLANCAALALIASL